MWVKHNLFVEYMAFIIADEYAVIESILFPPDDGIVDIPWGDILCQQPQIEPGDIVSELVQPDLFGKDHADSVGRLRQPSNFCNFLSLQIETWKNILFEFSSFAYLEDLQLVVWVDGK